MVRTANKNSSEDTQVEDSQVDDSLVEASQVSVEDTQVETGAEAAQTSQNTEGAAQAEEAAQGIEKDTLRKPAWTASASKDDLVLMLRQILARNQQLTDFLKQLAEQSHQSYQNQLSLNLCTDWLAAQTPLGKPEEAAEAETDEPDEEPEEAAETDQAEQAATEVEQVKNEIGSQAGSAQGPNYCAACQMRLDGQVQMDHHILSEQHMKTAWRMRKRSRMAA